MQVKILHTEHHQFIHKLNLYINADILNIQIIWLIIYIAISDKLHIFRDRIGTKRNLSG